MSKNWVEDKIIQFDYTNLNDKNNLMRYCELADINLSKIPHSKMKNYVINNLLMSNDLKCNDKYLFMFLYDLKSQQKYLPGLNISNLKIAFILWISDTTVWRAIKNLESFNLIIDTKDRFDERILIINENIITWKLNLYNDRLTRIEELRKHMAGSNVQLTNDYKSFIKQSNWN